MNFLETLWLYLTFIVSLLSPFEPKRPSFKIAPGLRHFLHGLLMLIILVVLWYLNERFKIYEEIPNPQWAAHFWLPIIFILLYALAVTGW